MIFGAIVALAAMAWKWRTGQGGGRHRAEERPPRATFGIDGESTTVDLEDLRRLFSAGQRTTPPR
jgi:hypothetical protein